MVRNYFVSKAEDYLRLAESRHSISICLLSQQEGAAVCSGLSQDMDLILLALWLNPGFLVGDPDCEWSHSRAQ